MVKEFPEVSIKRYRQYKFKVRSLERMNYDTIMMIPCSGNKNWHEMADHSALIYYYEVCKMLNRKVKFYADILSLYDQYDIGYIRSLGVDSVRSNLKKAKLYRSEEKEGDLLIFYLNTSYSKETIKRLHELELKRRENNLLPEPTGSLSPALHQILTHSADRMHKLCNQHLDRLSSQTIGKDVVVLIDGLLETYHKIAMTPEKSQAKIVQRYGKMRKDLYILIIKIRVIGEAKLWDFDVCSSLTEPLTKARDIVEQELEKLQKGQSHGTR